MSACHQHPCVTSHLLWLCQTLAGPVSKLKMAVFFGNGSQAGMSGVHSVTCADADQVLCISLIACHWQAARHTALMCNMLSYGNGSSAVKFHCQSELSPRQRQASCTNHLLCMLQANQLQSHDSPYLMSPSSWQGNGHFQHTDAVQPSVPADCTSKFPASHVMNPKLEMVYMLGSRLI